MRSIEATASISEDGKLTVQVPRDIPAGEHQVVVVIDEKPVTKKQRPPLKFSAYPVGLVSEDFTFRREDLYDNQ